MGEFFGSLYCGLFRFEDWFGKDLAEYLWGNASPVMTTNMFVGIGLCMLGISLGFMWLFYYLIDSPKLNNLLGWLIFLVINAVINFIIGWQWVLSDLYAGKMVNQNGDPLAIDESNCLCFGGTNMILSIFAFFIFSICFKWKSSNCSRAPFVK